MLHPPSVIAILGRMTGWWLVVVPGIVVLVVFALVWTSRASARFVITIRDGRVADVRGEVPDAYLRDVERICALWSIQRGRIIARRGPRRLKLSVAGGIPREHAQTFQNAWDHPI